MTASAANGFGQVKFAPSPSTQCKNIPYDFHPMYSTSSTADHRAVGGGDLQRRDRHRDRPLRLLQRGGRRDRQLHRHRGRREQQEPADADDAGCLPGSASGLIQIGGCEGIQRRLRRDLVPRGLAERHLGPSNAVHLHQPADRTELQHQLLVGRLQHGPAGDRGPARHVRHQHRRGLHDHPADRRRDRRRSSTRTTPRARARRLRVDRRTERIPASAPTTTAHTISTASCSRSRTPEPGGVASYSYNDYQNNLANNPCPR